MAFVITKLYTTHMVVYVQILSKLPVVFAEIRPPKPKKIKSNSCTFSVRRSVSARFRRICESAHRHAREPLYSNSAVIAWCSQSTGAQNILFWFTVIHSMSQFFTTFNFHDVFFISNYCLGIVVHSGQIRAFKF